MCFPLRFETILPSSIHSIGNLNEKFVPRLYIHTHTKLSWLQLYYLIWMKQSDDMHAGASLKTSGTIRVQLRYHFYFAQSTQELPAGMYECKAFNHTLFILEEINESIW